MKYPIFALPAFFVLIILIMGTPASGDQNGQAVGGQDSTGAVFERPHRLGELIHSDVTGRAGEVLGTVEDLVANEQGTLEYLILSKKAFLEIGVELVAIPLDTVPVRVVHQNRVIVDIDEATLEAATPMANDDRGKGGGCNGQ